MSWFNCGCKNVPEPEIKPLVPAELVLALIAKEMHCPRMTYEEFYNFVKALLPSASYPRKQ